MTVTSMNKAWEAAKEMAHTAFILDKDLTERAGYKVYKSADDKATISDLNTRLELNFANGETINIWIEEEAKTKNNKWNYSCARIENYYDEKWCHDNHARSEQELKEIAKQIADNCKCVSIEPECGHEFDGTMVLIYESEYIPVKYVIGEKFGYINRITEIRAYN